jgi:hypothetical protein
MLRSARNARTIAAHPPVQAAATGGLQDKRLFLVCSDCGWNASEEALEQRIFDKLTSTADVQAPPPPLAKAAAHKEPPLAAQITPGPPWVRSAAEKWTAMRRPNAGEFLPLPYFPELERPKNLPLDVEESATALFLSEGDIRAAAERLQVTPGRLMRTVRKSLRLQRLRERLSSEPASNTTDGG